MAFDLMYSIPKQIYFKHRKECNCLIKVIIYMCSNIYRVKHLILLSISFIIKTLIC